VQERETLRVAAYCRVSTNNEDQLLSFDNQVQYYTEYIANKPNYTMAGIYADEGISGVSTNRREQFKKMIKDCEDGKIDMVITKSISRFARNTQDCLQYSRKLKNLGIGIYFEKENINTLDAAGELLFTIMSSLAQEESRSISENCRWGIRTKFKQGVMHLNANHFLGYDKDDKGNLVINEAQAAIVRRIYREFMNRLNPETIAARLTDEGVPGCMGEPKWAVSTIMHILENEKYKGDALLQKYYTSDFLSKKSVRNHGQVEQVYVKDSHPPIIERELWEAVQLEIERRRLFRERHNLRTLGRYTDEQPFTCRVVCGKCGAVYWRRTWTRGSRKIRVWQCGKRYQKKGVAGCKGCNLFEKDLEKAFLTAWNGIVENREGFLPAWEKQIKEGNALEKWRAGQMVQLTTEPPLEAICPEIVNMTLESVEVHDGGLLHFRFLDGTELEIDTEEE
jgi:DNA invertase Pin-like site-specific DNA recombinase